MVLLYFQRCIPWLLHNHHHELNSVMAGVSHYAWNNHPDWDPSLVAKIVQRYPQHHIGYHFCMLMFGEGKKLAGSMTAAIISSKKKPSSFTCWIFN
jgi:hypothetical protein